MTFNANPSAPLYFELSNPVNLSTSFLIFEGQTHYGNDNTIGSEEFDRVRLFNETTVEYDVGANPNTGPQTDLAEVIDWNDGSFVENIQSDLATLGQTQTSITISPSISVNPNRTLLFVNYMEGTGGSTNTPTSQGSILATLNSNGDIIIQRSATGPELLLSWQLIEFGEGYAQVYHIQGNF